MPKVEGVGAQRSNHAVLCAQTNCARLSEEAPADAPFASAPFSGVRLALDHLVPAAVPFRTLLVDGIPVQRYCIFHIAMELGELGFGLRRRGLCLGIRWHDVAELECLALRLGRQK